MNSSFELKPIGVVHSSLTTGEQVRNSDKSANLGEVELFQEYTPGLRDIEGFSHIVIVFWMDRAKFDSLEVTPIYEPDSTRGLFATLHPNRPNPVGITIAQLLEKQENILKVKGIDIFDSSPVIDIKPYTESYRKDIRKFGWPQHNYPNAQTD